MILRTMPGLAFAQFTMHVQLLSTASALELWSISSLLVCASTLLKHMIRLGTCVCRACGLSLSSLELKTSVRALVGKACVLALPGVQWPVCSISNRTDHA